MNPAAVIRKKRDGASLTDDDILEFIRGFVDGGVADYQMSALLMAVFLRGMDSRETATLTRAMVETGSVLEFPGLSGAKVDKHSTGGVGDLISLPLAPLVAANGVYVPMISGRGLGHTGGTLDKLESIRGLRTGLDPDTFRRVLGETGFAMGGQTEDLAPADRRMYALRDVTATVECIPLIVSSILSKKIAEGIDALVLDVKCGRGAFMKTEADALALARELTRVGTLMGKQVAAFVTDMSEPLGLRIGNGLEAHTAVDCLRGEGPDDVMELVEVLGAAMLCLGGAETRFAQAAERVRAAVFDGSGLDRFRRMVALQGGDVSLLEAPERLHAAPVSFPVAAPEAGVITGVDPYGLGMAVVELGGGRRRAEDTVDPAVGVVLHVKRGASVSSGDVLATVLAADAESAARAAREWVLPAFAFGERADSSGSLVRYLITGSGERPWQGPESWDLPTP